MPRALLRDILLEKKKNLKYPTQGEFYAKLDLLKSSCVNINLELTVVKNTLGRETQSLSSVAEKVKKCMDLISKMRSDREKYQWNDESVQDMVDKLDSDIQQAFIDLKKSRESGLGKNDALKYAEDYYYQAESLKDRGNKILFNIASIEKQEKKERELKQNTDPFTENTLDDKLDIVAKKGIVKKENESDDAYKKRKAEEEKIAILRRDGIIRVVASLIGVTFEELSEKYNKGEAKDKLAARIAMFNEVIPFIERITGRKYERCSEKEGKGVFDPQFIQDISVLAEYRGYYENKYYKSSREEDKKESDSSQFSEGEYKKIEEKMKSIKGEISTLLSNLKKNNEGESIKNKEITEVVKQSEEELNEIELKYSCSRDNLSSLKKEKNDLIEKKEKYKSFLDSKDIEILGEIVNKMEEIEKFCDSFK